LLFQKRFHEGLLGGQITLTFRRGPHARVKAGGKYRSHPLGVFDVDAVSRERVAQITQADARQAGFRSRAELLGYLSEHGGPVAEDEEVFRIRLHHAGEADFAPNAQDAALDREARRQIDEALRKLDAKATSPWTQATLKLVAKRPRVAASQLAEAVGRPTAPFKADVVKLKKLGLTQSYEVGYDLTPRGRAYLKRNGPSRA
jgi:hypothetical protein